MKLKISITTHLKTKEVLDKVNSASAKGLKDVVVDIANDVIKGSPVKTGNNRRNIKYETKGLTGFVYSTSGYGGYLEVGTHNPDKSWKMLPRPYFKPAYDKHYKELPKRIKARLK